jgi:hypothetical protein
MQIQNELLVYWNYACDQDDFAFMWKKTKISHLVIIVVEFVKPLTILRTMLCGPHVYGSFNRESKPVDC